ncbi:hypothetical protein GQ54DRAFT_14749 [Martensiomyces pterosporus]|nr:hypothetical protein GQ54DRAFT_14749 [Martensiomyces pterosporus]
MHQEQALLSILPGASCVLFSSADGADGECGQHAYVSEAHASIVRGGLVPQPPTPVCPLLRQQQHAGIWAAVTSLVGGYSGVLIVAGMEGRDRVTRNIERCCISHNSGKAAPQGEHYNCKEGIAWYSQPGLPFLCFRLCSLLFPKLFFPTLQQLSCSSD